MTVNLTVLYSVQGERCRDDWLIDWLPQLREAQSRKVCMGRRQGNKESNKEWDKESVFSFPKDSRQNISVYLFIENFYYESQLPYMFKCIKQETPEDETVLSHLEPRQECLWKLVTLVIGHLRNDSHLQSLHPAIQQYIVELHVWRLICEASPPLFPHPKTSLH